MNIGVFQETNPVAAGHVLVWSLYKKSAPTVLIDHGTYPGPYTGQTQLHTFAAVQPVMYVYICWESPDGTASGTSRNNFDIQPGSTSFNERDDLFMIADESPNMPSGAGVYGPDASLVGWNWGLEFVAAGTQQYGVDYVKTVAGVDTTQDDLNADGWRLLAAGNVFQPGDKYVAHFLPQIAATTSGGATALISQTNILNITTTLDNTAIGQSFMLQGSGGYLQVNLPALATVPDNEPLYIISAGGTHVNAGIFGNAGESFEWYRNGSALSGAIRTDHIYLGQCENLTIYKVTYPDSSAHWVVLSGGEGYRTVGEQVLSYSLPPLNTVQMLGQTLSRANYARLWEWVQTLETGILINDSAFNHTTTGGTNGLTYNDNWGRYTRGDGSTTFRVPKLTQYGIQRIVEGAAGRIASSFAITTTESHHHATQGDGGGAAGSGGFNGSGGPYYLSRNVNGAYSGSGGDLVGRKTTAGGYDRTLRTGNDNGVVGIQGETMPNNTGIYALIRI